MNLRGVIPDKAVEAIDKMGQRLDVLADRFDRLARKNLVTREEGETLFGPARQRKDLQVSGSHPLNVAGLLGVLAEPQAGNSVPDGTYTTGAKLTSGGTPGTITISGGKIVNITSAT